jgi:hypothetical protein
MDDETVMLHLENRHANEVLVEFRVEPDREERRLVASKEWREFHEAQHRLSVASSYDHVHNEER